MALGLTACSSSPPPVSEPRLRLQANEVEALGARRYAQGEYAGAARQFAEATRLHQSLDDEAAVARNRLQLAHTLLALGQAQQALEQAQQVRQPGLQVSAGLLQVQARLALSQLDAARDLLTKLDGLCPTACEERGRLLLLRARVAWAGGDVAQTGAQTQAALPLLRERGELRELANGWRLLAAARLKAADAPGALAAAQAALAIDRQQALPEKISRDWLLIGDIQRQSAQDQAREAYQRARSVAQAAGLKALVREADDLLKEMPP